MQFLTDQRNLTTQASRLYGSSGSAFFNTENVIGRVNVIIFGIMLLFSVVHFAAKLAWSFLISLSIPSRGGKNMISNYLLAGVL